MKVMNGSKECERITRDVKAGVIMYQGAIVADYMARWSKVGVCSVLVEIYTDGEENIFAIGKAGGAGYDKFSAALAEALRDTYLDKIVEHGAGNAKHDFHAHGLELVTLFG